ncbi:hypothetical protein PO909_030648 [Leuciscus waleckii]
MDRGTVDETKDHGTVDETMEDQVGLGHGAVDETMEDQMDMMEPVEIESTMAEPAEEMATSAEQKTRLGIRRPWQNRGNDGFSGHDRAGMAVTWSTEFSWMASIAMAEAAALGKNLIPIRNVCYRGIIMVQPQICLVTWTASTENCFPKFIKTFLQENRSDSEEEQSFQGQNLGRNLLQWLEGSQGKALKDNG